MLKKFKSIKKKFNYLKIRLLIAKKKMLNCK